MLYKAIVKDRKATDDIFIIFNKNGWNSNRLNISIPSHTTFKKKADILVEIDKQDVAYGDGVIVKYSLLSDSQYIPYRISRFPEYKGFIKRFVDPGNITRSIKFEGKNKFITSLYHVELFPIEGEDKLISDMEIIVFENTKDEFYYDRKIQILSIFFAGILTLMPS